MEIVWLGQSSFRIKGKEASIVTDPFDSKMVGVKYPRVEADIVTISHDHGDHNQSQLVGGSPKVVKNPGEYEIKEVSILGIPTHHDAQQGAERGHNTVFVMKIDSINICHLGDLGHKLSEDQIEQIGNIDVLFVPVGGFYTIDTSRAVEVVSSLEPRIVIPMHYKFEGADVLSDLAGVEDFIKEIGVEPVKDSKFVITQDKIPTEMQVVVLERKV